jgi:hypothetical protein
VNFGKLLMDLRLLLLNFIHIFQDILTSCSSFVRVVVYQPSGPGSIPGMYRSELLLGETWSCCCHYVFVYYIKISVMFCHHWTKTGKFIIKIYFWVLMSKANANINNFFTNILLCLFEDWRIEKCLVCIEFIFNLSQLFARARSKKLCKNINLHWYTVTICCRCVLIGPSVISSWSWRNF